MDNIILLSENEFYLQKMMEKLKHWCDRWKIVEKYRYLELVFNEYSDMS